MKVSSQRCTMHPNRSTALQVERSRRASSANHKLKSRGRGRPKGSSGKSKPSFGYSDSVCYDARVWRNLSPNLSRFEG